MPLNEEQSLQCPVCKSDAFINPSIRFLVSPCYHRVCESCIGSLFSHGSGPCPVCGTALRRSNWTIPQFEDLRVERECRIRQRLATIFTKTEMDFQSLRDYNDYLEEVEGIVFNLLNDVDVERTNERLEAYRKTNLEQIARSRTRKEAEEAEWRRQEELDRQRRLEYEMQLVAELEEEQKEREREESRFIEELARSSAGRLPTNAANSGVVAGSRKRKIGENVIVEMPSYRGLRDRTVPTITEKIVFDPFETVPPCILPFSLAIPSTIPPQWFIKPPNSVLVKAGGMQVDYLANYLAASFISCL